MIATVARRHAPLLQGLGMLAVFAAVLANLGRPLLRLEPAPLNFVALLGACALPWLALQRLCRAYPRWWGVVTALVSPTLGCASLLVFGLILTLLVGAGNALGGGGEPPAAPTTRHATEPVVDLVAGKARLRSPDCGAPCGFVQVLRQERRLVPGILLVRDVAHWSRAVGGSLQAVDPWQVHVMVRYTARPGEEVRDSVVTLRPWVYF